MMFIFFLATELSKSVEEIMQLTTLEVAGWKQYYNHRAMAAKNNSKGIR